MAGAGSPWDLIDHDLVKLKLADVAKEMLESITAEQEQIRLDNRNNENREMWLLLKMRERRAGESVEKTYQVYCDVWNKQGYGKTADFVRAISAHVIEGVIKAQTGGALAWLADLQVRTNADIGPHRARMANFPRKMQRLLEHWRRKLEIEAKEREHLARQQKARADAGEAQIESRPEAIQSPTSKAERTLARKMRNPSSYPTLSVREVAVLFSKSESTIYRWLEEEKLQSSRVVGRILTKSAQSLLTARKDK